jgi:hypothetical protein
MDISQAIGEIRRNRNDAIDYLFEKYSINDKHITKFRWIEIPHSNISLLCLYEDLDTGEKLREPIVIIEFKMTIVDFVVKDVITDLRFSGGFDKYMENYASIRNKR